MVGAEEGLEEFQLSIKYVPMLERLVDVCVQVVRDVLQACDRQRLGQELHTGIRVDVVAHWGVRARAGPG